MKRWIIPLLAAALLLSACGTQTASPAEMGESPAPRPPAEESPGYPDAERDAPEEEPEEIIGVDQRLFSPESCRYTLLDDEEIRFELLFTKDMATGQALVIYRVENRCEEEIRLTVSEVLLNGSVRTGDEDSLTVPPGEIRQNAYHPGLIQSCAFIGYENLRDFSATLRLEKGAGENGEPRRCGVSFPEGICLRFCYESFREGRAERQILKTDEGVCIALLGCGRFYEDYSWDRLRGVLWIENRGEEAIPVALSGLAVNGVNLPISARSREALPPHGSLLLDFTVEGSEFELAGIGSVESLSLQILTSSEENSGGSMGVVGGTWYPVALAASGKAENAAVQGTVIYDDGLLQLSLVSAEIKASARPGILDAEYTLYVVNRRTDGISLYFSEPMVGELPYVNALTDTNYIGKKNIRYGPRSEGYTVLTLELPAEAAEDSVPAFSFLLQVRSQGGDSIFYAIPERIRLSENMEDQS